jgi:hypothetical protein
VFENITFYPFPRHFHLAACIFCVVLFSPVNVGVVLLSLLLLCAVARLPEDGQVRPKHIAVDCDFNVILN